MQRSDTANRVSNKGPNATFGSPGQAISYARLAGFSVFEGNEAIADRPDMPDVEFVLTYEQQPTKGVRRCFWRRVGY